ncbi:Rieske 2Fe-2S domain-containing protein [Bradyrhizobium sp. UNPA324]|uniref:Rieske (2Fe-2S) protein n=1 Tax=Bradyrhizobium sp. UNPA324 TaxID=1141174 RepID=UPI00114E0E7B|nr:Rieske 2Fe-2S domain-containing protein [Bradyrhizobium sp. UNPA324]TQF29599.1 (2Fe-2S)-binding protein [Bradyrhizobium sp. UNPA324]
MSLEEIDVFVICASDEIERGSARAFNLSRIDGSGEGRPFPIVVIRTHGNDYVGYVNACPHDGVWLNIGSGDFFTQDRAFLKCGRHGAAFEIDSGLCIDGPCNGKSLQPIALAMIDGEVCLFGEQLVEDDRPFGTFDDHDETMDIMIHPD